MGKCGHRGVGGFTSAVLVNFGITLVLAMRGTSPEIPAKLDQRFLVLQTWGFLVPFVWGFSAKWLPVFLGLRSLRGRALLFAVALNSAGVLLAFAGWMRSASLVLVVGLATAVYALRLFEPVAGPAKVKGVHSSFPVFVRLAYVWALVAGTLGIWAASVENSHGIWGASRHALTRWISSDNGICNRAACITGVLRDGTAVQYEAHVRRDLISLGRMSVAREFGNSRLSRLGAIGVDLASCFRHHRNDGGNVICV